MLKSRVWELPTLLFVCMALSNVAVLMLQGMHGVEWLMALSLQQSSCFSLPGLELVCTDFLVWGFNRYSVLCPWLPSDLWHSPCLCLLSVGINRCKPSWLSGVEV